MTIPTLLRFSALKARGIVRNWPTLLRWIREHDFPQGIAIGPNATAW
jgi:predicted DNA-binding transcriptional regulator AlpA